MKILNIQATLRIGPNPSWLEKSVQVKCIGKAKVMNSKKKKIEKNSLLYIIKIC